MAGTRREKDVNIGRVAKVKTKKQKKQKRDVFWKTPFFEGVLGLIPILVLMIVLGLGWLKNIEETKMMTGEYPERVENHIALAKEAAIRNDWGLAEKEYFLAKRLMERNESLVLGWNSEIEDIVWPEKKIEKEIERLKSINKESSISLWLRLSELYMKIGKMEESKQSWNEAKKIDGNDSTTKEVGKELSF